MPPNPEPTSPAPSPDHELVLQVIENAAPAELFRQACDVCQGARWYFGTGSAEGDGARFWRMDLEGNAAFDALWEQVRPQCEALAGGPLRVLRQYANGHTYGLGGRPHVDDFRPGTFTFLYYPMPEWKDTWDGETVYYDRSGEIMFAVKPRPNRGLFFDSRISHDGRAPSRSCTALRITVAYKLEFAADAGKDAPVPASQPEPSPLSHEIRREGTTRVYRIGVPSAEVDAAVAAHLASLAETVKLPGFRSGRIPEEILRQRYGAEARREAVQRLSAAAIDRSLPKGICPASVELKSGEKSGDVEVHVAGTYLPDLPVVDFSQMPFERLTVSEAVAQAAGLRLEEAVDALREDLKGQVLDQLDATYRIPMLPVLVERELTSIWKAVEASGEKSSDAKDRVQKRNELRLIAERRLRLGWLVTEIARRAGITTKDGRDLEDKVVDHLLSMAQGTEREVTPEELRDLTAD